MKLLTLFTAFGFSALAGGLNLEITQGSTGTLLNARVTACHEPAKSIVKASVVTIVDGQLNRQPLRVEAVANQPGVFAISGSMPDATVVVEVAVTNPEYPSYEPRALLRAAAGKIQLASRKQFFSVPPKLADYRQTLTD